MDDLSFNVVSNLIFNTINNSFEKSVNHAEMQETKQYKCMKCYIMHSWSILLKKYLTYTQMVLRLLIHCLEIPP